MDMPAGRCGRATARQGVFTADWTVFNRRHGIMHEIYQSGTSLFFAGSAVTM